MKTTKSTSKIFAMMAAVGLMVGFSSCNGDDETADSNQPQAVRFSADIANQALPDGAPGTRAAGTTWANGDAIGIFMVDNGATTIAEGAANKQFTTDGTSAFTAVSGDEIYYPMDGSKVDFIAYYPYAAANTTPGTINIGIGAQTNQPAFDLLWTKADNSGTGYDKNTHKTTPVGLAFDHKLSKIVMNVKAEANTGISDLNTATVVINDMFTQNTFDLATGALGAAHTTAAITPRKLGTEPSGFLASYDAIIMPHTYNAGDVTVVFTVGGNPYTWTLKAADAVFAPGNEYTYAVTLTRTGVQVSGTITPWTTSGNDRGGVTAE